MGAHAVMVVCLLLTLVYASQTTHGSANVFNVLYCSLSCV